MRSLNAAFLARTREKIMSGRVNAKGRNRFEPHVRLHHFLLRSEAWRRLSLAGRALLVELYALHNGTNNGDLFLSVREAARRLGVGKNKAHATFGELIEKGFIKCAQKGAFSYKVRHASQWILTEHAVGDALATKDFMRWRAPEIQNPVPAAETDGPPAGDKAAPEPPLKLSDGLRPMDRNPSFDLQSGPCPVDTVSKPGGGGGDEKISSFVSQPGLDFGARVAERRKAFGMSQMRLAEQCGLTRGAVGHIEAGRRAGRPDVRARLAAALNISGG